MSWFRPCGWCNFETQKERTLVRSSWAAKPGHGWLCWLGEVGGRWSVVRGDWHVRLFPKSQSAIRAKCHENAAGKFGASSGVLCWLVCMGTRSFSMLFRGFALVAPSSGPRDGLAGSNTLAALTSTLMNGSTPPPSFTLLPKRCLKVWFWRLQVQKKDRHSHRLFRSTSFFWEASEPNFDQGFRCQGFRVFWVLGVSRLRFGVQGSWGSGGVHRVVTQGAGFICSRLPWIFMKKENSTNKREKQGRKMKEKQKKGKRKKEKKRLKRCTPKTDQKNVVVFFLREKLQEIVKQFVAEIFLSTRKKKKTKGKQRGNKGKTKGKQRTHKGQQMRKNKQKKVSKKDKAKKERKNRRKKEKSGSQRTSGLHL